MSSIPEHRRQDVSLSQPLNPLFASTVERNNSTEIKRRKNSVELPLKICEL